MNTAIKFNTKEEDAAALEEFFEQQRAMSRERHEAISMALPALDRLAVVMQGRSGQPYKLRNFLFSLWNGKPASLVEIVNLDWEIRRDLVLLLMAYGYEEKGAACFYDAIQNAVTKAGQWEWFLEEQHNVKVLADYVQAAKEAR